MAEVVERAADTYVQMGRPLSQDRVRSGVPASQAVSEEMLRTGSRKKAGAMRWTKTTRDRIRFMSRKTTLAATWRKDRSQRAAGSVRTG